MNLTLTPFLIIVWLGFVGCVALLLSLRLSRNVFQQRMHDTLNPTHDYVDNEIIDEQHNDDMNQSLIHRVLAPTLKKMAAGKSRRANDKQSGQLREMLEQAGHPLGMGYPEFVAFKTLTSIFMLGLGILTQFFGVPLLLGIFVPEAVGDMNTRLIFSALWVMIFVYIGFSGPVFWLRFYLNKRLRQIRKSMADVVDLIVLAIEAGLGFDQAVGQAVETTEGPLSDELRRVLDEIRVGRQQSDAFRAMAERIRMQ